MLRRASATGARSRPMRSSSDAWSTRGDGKVGAEFRVWDVAGGKQLAGQRFSTAARNWRRIGHLDRRQRL